MLTYQDRPDAIRRAKIAHTFAKREQNGYTDLDDFGTVSFPEGGAYVVRVTGFATCYVSRSPRFHSLAADRFSEGT